MSSKGKGIAWIFGAVALAFFAAFISTPVIQRFPWRCEKSLAKRLDDFPLGIACRKAEGVAALRELVARIYPRLANDSAVEIRVEVLRGGPVNAFASLGGRIYIYEELIEKARSPDEVAGVLAHEIGHVTGRHLVEGAALRVMMFALWPADTGGLLRLFANLKFGRAQEEAADRAALRRLQAAKISPAALGDFFERLGGAGEIPAFLSDHPSSESRVGLARDYRVKNPEPALSATAWENLRDICTP